jgi:hypothetical protein
VEEDESHIELEYRTKKHWTSLEPRTLVELRVEGKSFEEIRLNK